MVAAPLASDPELLVLLALRLKSFAMPEAVAESIGLDLSAVVPVLAGLADRELVKFREGRITGWVLTPAGRAAGAQLLDHDRSTWPVGVEPEIRGAYALFLTHNQPFLELCTDWQLVGGAASQVLNDHTDTVYDAEVIARLVAFDRDVQPILATLAGTLNRFADYGERCSSALGGIAAGNVDLFTKPLVDSYHTIWFELHEHLLATLGIERSSEQSP